MDAFPFVTGNFKSVIVGEIFVPTTNPLSETAPPPSSVTEPPNSTVV